MKARMVRIGNSWVVRVPKTLINQAGLDEDVEINVQGKSVIVGPRGARAMDGRLPSRKWPAEVTTRCWTPVRYRPPAGKEKSGSGDRRRSAYRPSLGFLIISAAS